MNMNDLFLKFFPAITAMLQMGFIPTPENIHELTPEQYAAYQIQGGDVSKRLYTIRPKGNASLSSVPANEVSIMTEDDIPKLGEAVFFIYQYAKNEGCTSQKSEQVLKFVAERLPASFTKGTKFERPNLKVLEAGEIPLSEKEEWVDLLASVLGEGTTLKMKVTHKDTNKTENITIPLIKQRKKPSNKK